MRVTADDLLSLCSTVHAARLGLAGADPAPRVRTLERLGDHADRDLTDAALAYERLGAHRRIIGDCRRAAEALVFAAELAMIGIDEQGYVQLPDAGRPVLAPGDGERAAHARFLDDVAGVSASLFTLAGSLEEQDEHRQLDNELLAELVDEATLELRRAADPEAVPRMAPDREAGMVWMTFCRMVLDDALRGLESSDPAAPATLAHLATMQQALDPRREQAPAPLVGLAAAMLDAHPRI
jgi:hypothetical protein